MQVFLGNYLIMQIYVIVLKKCIEIIFQNTLHVLPV